MSCARFTARLALASAALSGCADISPHSGGVPLVDESTVVADEAVLGTRQQALHGPLTVDGCDDPADDAAVRAAIDRHRTRAGRRR